MTDPRRDPQAADDRLVIGLQCSTSAQGRVNPPFPDSSGHNGRSMDMKRPVVVAVFLAGLMLGTAVPVSGLGGTQITLNCDDGTSLTAVVDASTVTDLTQSVQALIDYPAGLSCTLLQTTPLVRFGNAADAA